MTWREPHCDKFACLTYHLIGEGSGQYILSEMHLRHQLDFLNTEGYIIDDFEGLEAKLRAEAPLPNRYVVLTIDDGHESSMRVADMLQAHQFRATFFLSRDRCLGKPNFIRESHIRELRKRGFSLGTHGTTHRKLSFMHSKACAFELEESKQWLEDVLGEGVRYMSAPGGYINDRVLQLAYESGYILVGTCRERMNSSCKMRLPCTVNRVNIRRQFSHRDFCSVVGGHLVFYSWRQIRSEALSLPKQILR